MAVDTEGLRHAGEVLDALTSKLPDTHALRAHAAQDAKNCVAVIYSAADHIDAQTAALSVAREFIATARSELVVTHGINGVIPADDTLGLAGVADCDAILGQIDAALLAQHQGEKHD